MIDPTTINPSTLPFVSLAERADLPKDAGLYFVVSADDAVLYIGRASRSLRGRWLDHEQLQGLRTRGGCRIAWLHVDEAALLSQLESACIDYFDPPLNKIRGKQPGGYRDRCLLIEFSRMSIIEKLRRMADDKDMPVTVMVRGWIMDRMREEERRDTWVAEFVDNELDSSRQHRP